MLYLALYPLHKYYSGFNALRYETLPLGAGGTHGARALVGARTRPDRAVSRGCISARPFATKFRKRIRRKPARRPWAVC